MVLLVFFLSFFLLLPGSNSQNAWQDQEVLADGKPIEWKQPLDFFDQGTGLRYAIRNDSNNLYICLQALLPVYQYQLIQKGAIVEIKAKGKPKLQARIEYPYPQNLANAYGQMSSKLQIREQFIANQQHMYIEGFQVEDGEKPVHATDGISAGINWDLEDIMTYEISIAWNKLFEEGTTFEEISEKNFEFTLTLPVKMKMDAGQTVDMTGLDGSALQRNPLDQNPMGLTPGADPYGNTDMNTNPISPGEDLPEFRTDAGSSMGGTDIILKQKFNIAVSGNE